MKFDRQKLEALLGRVERNGAAPRAVPAAVLVASVPAAALPAAAAAPAASVAPVVPVATRSPAYRGLELDEPGMDSLTPPSGGADRPSELDLDAPPESGSGPVRGAQMLDPADDIEPPPLTPPPESGEEPAPKVSIPRDPGPTMAQLGQTIALEESAGQVLELDEPLPPPSRRGDDQLAVSLSSASLGQSYSEELPLPENARDELDRVRLGQSAEVGPTVHARPVLSTNVVDFVSAVRSYQPETFLELLDASLGL